MRNQEIDKYVYEVIVPKYADFDAAHREDHAHAVIDQAMKLLDDRPRWVEEHSSLHGQCPVNQSELFVVNAELSNSNADVSSQCLADELLVPVDRSVLKMAAACHDLGLVNGRDRHHLDSGEIIRNDTNLRNWFSDAEIETIAQAAEDHRASGDKEPRCIYGKLVAEADRLIDPQTIIKRTIQFGFKHYPHLGREGHIERAISHLKEKYGRGGYLKLWIPWSENAARLGALQDVIADDAAIYEEVVRMYDLVNVQ